MGATGFQCGDTALSGWNSIVQDAWDRRMAGLRLPEPLLPESAWEDWTWRSDPTEPCAIECLVNRSQLLGLLLARYRGAMQSEFHGSQCTLVDFLGVPSTATESRLCLFAQRPVAEYTLRELRDSVQNLQVHWVQCQAVRLQGIMKAVDSCFHRLGVLASVAAGVRRGALPHPPSSPLQAYDGPDWVHTSRYRHASPLFAPQGMTPARRTVS